MGSIHSALLAASLAIIANAVLPLVGLLLVCIISPVIFIGEKLKERKKTAPPRQPLVNWPAVWIVGGGACLMIAVIHNLITIWT